MVIGNIVGIANDLWIESKSEAKVGKHSYWSFAHAILIAHTLVVDLPF